MLTIKDYEFIYHILYKKCDDIWYNMKNYGDFSEEVTFERLKEILPKLYNEIKNIGVYYE